MTQLAAVKGGRVRTDYHSRMEWVSVSAIDTESRAQRRFDENWAHKIAADFDPDKVGHPFVVAMPGKNGKERYFAIDGQHRIAAVKIALGPEQHVECEVVRGIDLARAAELFRGRNYRRSVRPLDIFLTGVTAGDPECVAIRAIVHDVHCVIPNNGTVADGAIMAVVSLQQIYRMEVEQKRGGLLRKVLTFVVATWGRGAVNFNGDVLKGIAFVLARHGADLDMDVLRHKLAQMSGGVLGLLGKARAYREAAGGSIAQCIARSIVTAYNTGRNKNRLPAWGE